MSKPFITQFIIYLMLIYIVKFGLNCYSNKGNQMLPKYFNSAIISLFTTKRSGGSFAMQRVKVVLL